MSDITTLSLADTRDGLAKGDFTSAELTDAYLSAIEGASDLNAFITVAADHARDQAKASDARRAAGDAGALEGVPLAIKDLFCTEGVLSTAASHISRAHGGIHRPGEGRHHPGQEAGQGPFLGDGRGLRAALRAFQRRRGGRAQYADRPVRGHRAHARSGQCHGSGLRAPYRDLTIHRLSGFSAP